MSKVRSTRTPKKNAAPAFFFTRPCKLHRVFFLGGGLRGRQIMMNRLLLFGATSRTTESFHVTFHIQCRAFQTEGEIAAQIKLNTCTHTEKKKIK